MTTRYLNQQEIQIATKFLPGSTTREHRNLIGVKTMPSGTNYSFYCHSLVCCQYSLSELQGIQRRPSDVLPMHQSHQSWLTRFSSYRRVTRGQFTRHLTRNGIDQCRNGPSNLLAPYREQPRSTRIVVAYPQLAFSATKRINPVPNSFDQQVQVSQGHTSYKNKENYNTEIHGGGGLDLVKPAREPASSRPKLCVSGENAPEILPVGRSLLALAGRIRPCQRSYFSSETPVRAFDSRAQGFNILLARRRSSFPLSSQNLVHAHPTVHAATHLRVLRRSSRLSATTPRASRVPAPPEGHQIEARKRCTW